MLDDRMSKEIRLLIRCIEADFVNKDVSQFCAYHFICTCV